MASDLILWMIHDIWKLIKHPSQSIVNEKRREQKKFQKMEKYVGQGSVNQKSIFGGA
jgi:hypothetical protein